MSQATSTPWPPHHDLPRCSRLMHLVGRLGLFLTGWRAEAPAPGIPKAIITAVPHTSNWDLVFALLGMWALGLKPSWLGKAELFRGPWGPLLRALGGQAVDRSAAHGLVDEVARRFREADRMLLLVPAEGTRSYRDYWKSGFYWMAEAAQVPILLGYLDYGRHRLGAGPALVPSGYLHADMDRVRAFYAGMTGKHPANASRIRLRDEDETQDSE